MRKRISAYSGTEAGGPSIDPHKDWWTRSRGIAARLAYYKNRGMQMPTHGKSARMRMYR